MQPSKSIGKLFGDLKVRPKFMVLHNLFFLVLTLGIYFSIIPLFESRVASARAREVSLVTQMFSEDRPLLRLSGMEIYEYQEGTAEQLHMSNDVREWLDAHPGAILQDPLHTDSLFRKHARTGLYRQVTLPYRFYDDVVFRAKVILLVVLAAIYLLAVAALEWVIMPRYVYRPIRLMLAADQATQHGKHQEELIADELILGDEIGQIMRSRNATVAELRRHEDELAAALQRLETAKRNIAEQDRLVSLGLLSASVAHELNTPLTVLRGSIEKLLETVSDAPARERLARMLRVTERLRSISEGLVDFSKVRKQEMEPVPVRPVIEEAWSLVAIDEKALESEFRDEVEPEAVVIGNADRLVQVFVNLLRNALYAIPSCGTIVVQSRLLAEEGQSWVLISVEDDGEGISPDVLPSIFEAFVTSRLDARGTGLGLTVAEGIVNQHGGTIEAGNRPGGGARLEVKLPAAPRHVIDGQVTR